MQLPQPIQFFFNSTISNSSFLVAATMGKKLSKSCRNILLALIKLDLANQSSPDRILLQIFARCFGTPEGFKKNLRTLKNQGLVSLPSGTTVSITEEGRAEIGDVVVRPATNADILGFIRDDILKKKNLLRVFDELLEAGRALSREELAAATNYEDKPEGFKKALSEMKRFGVLEYSKKNMVQLTDMVFLFKSH